MKRANLSIYFSGDLLREPPPAKQCRDLKYSTDTDLAWQIFGVLKSYLPRRPHRIILDLFEK